MQIKIEIKSELIAALFASAIEGGDPVTTAARGGWCSGIDLYESGASKSLDRSHWWLEKATFERPYRIRVCEVVDENTGMTKEHVLRPRDVREGLVAMAAVFPAAFARVLQDDIDGPCADLFLQATLFGKEKYA